MASDRGRGIVELEFNAFQSIAPDKVCAWIPHKTYQEFEKMDSLLWLKLNKCELLFILFSEIGELFRNFPDLIS